MSGGGGSGTTATFSLWFQIVLMAAITTMTVGGYYVYDMPGALKGCYENVYHISSTQQSLGYSLYSYPNIVMPFLFGYLVDRKLGRRKGILLFGSLVMAGQGIISLSAFIQQQDSGKFKAGNFILFLAGRIVYGLGNEAAFITQIKFISRWFAGKTMATGMALTMSISRMGSAMNFFFSPRIANSGGTCHHLDLATMVGLFFTIGSFVGILGTLALDAWAEKEERRQARENAKAESTYSPAKEVGGLNSEEKIEDEGDNSGGASGSMSIGDIVATLKRVPVGAWLVICICVFFYNCIFTFMTFAQSFIAPVYFHKSCGHDTAVAASSKEATTNADGIISIPYTFSAAGAAVMGLLVDRLGRNIDINIFACTMMGMVHTCLWMAGHGGLKFTPIVLMLAMGASYTMVGASLWPMLVPLVAPEDLATAYGLMDGMQQLGLGLFANLAGALGSCTVPGSGISCPACYPALLPKVLNVELMLTVSAIAAVCCSVALYLVPQSKILNLPQKQQQEALKKAYAERQEAQGENDRLIQKQKDLA